MMDSAYVYQLLPALFFISVIAISFLFIRQRLKYVSWQIVLAEFAFLCAYFFASALFLLACAENSAHHTEAIVPDFNGYSPFSIDHSPTLITFLILFWISAILVWFKRSKLPPLLLVLSLSFLTIGIVIGSISILQVTHYDDPNPVSYDNLDPAFAFFFALFPALNIILALVLIIKTIRMHGEVSNQRNYSNLFLDRLNSLIATAYNLPTWVLISIFPVFLLVTCILVLFGQETNSIVKVFTETTCWRFSEMSHPDYLPSRGHYLCTVAARGDRKIVRPLRIGNRHGQEIIVNRQLMVANAFEEMIQESTPGLHKIIRSAYDKYGFPLSKYINTPLRSNITYFVMKPLEWLFLFFLYLFCNEPEMKIERQYKL